MLALLMVGWLVLAAASGPVRIWTNPSTEGGAAETPVAPEVVDPPPRGEANPGSAPTSFPLTRPVVIAVLAGAVVLAGLAIRELGPPLAMMRFGRRGRTAAPVSDPLPAVDEEPTVRMDVEAIRRALADGPPRDAIVRCWIQVRDGASAAGLGPRASETSTEFVQRAVASASLDPGPISELAALYTEARFSHHELTDADRTRASEAVERVVNALAPVAGRP